MAISIRAGERALFLGKPGWGKSNLMMWLLEDVANVVVMDSKSHEAEWAPWARRRRGLVTDDPEHVARAPIVVFQVDQRALDDREGWTKPGSVGYQWTAALEACLRRRTTVVVFDEVLQTMPAGGAHPQARRIYTQGRKFGLSAWAGTQIANRMDTLVARIAEHCFAFHTNHAKDVALLSDARAVDCSQLAQLPRFHFGYHYQGSDEWVMCGAVDNLMDRPAPAQRTNFEPSSDAQSEDQIEDPDTAPGALAEAAETR